MLRKLKTSNVRKRGSWPENGVGAVASGHTVLSKPSTIERHDKKPASVILSSGVGKSSSLGESSSLGKSSNLGEVLTPPAAAQPDALSVRAENVLKNLAPELMGETPPKGRWTPPPRLLRSLSYSDIAGARNCGPQTVNEILRWAKSQGVIIKRPFHAGKSLSAMWRDIIAKSRTQEYTMEEIAEALERSMRRKNTRIPVGFQNLLMNLLNTAGK
jgi:hypothetical protein